MKKIMSVFCLTFLSLPVFASVQDFMNKALDSWIGYSIDHVIKYWNYPTEEKTIANRHIFIWENSWQGYVPPIGSSYGYFVTYYCNKTFETDEQNNIIDYSWEGNRCPAFYKTGKRLVNPDNDSWETKRLEKKRIKTEKAILKQQEKLKNNKTAY